MEFKLTKPSVGGIGMTLGHKYPSRNVAITAVKPGSAAAAAGLEAGDLIVSIDGTDLTGKGVPDVKRALQRITGTVTVTVASRDDTVDAGTSSTPAAPRPATTTTPTQSTTPPKTVDDRGLASATDASNASQHSPAMRRLLKTGVANPTAPAPRVSAPSTSAGDVNTNPKPTSVDASGEGALDARTVTSPQPTTEDRGLSSAATPRPGPSEARLLGSQGNVTASPPAPRAAAPPARPAPPTKPSVGDAAPPPHSDPRRAEAVASLRESLGGLMRGVKLVRGEKEVVLKTRVCAICNDVIASGSFLQNDGQCFHPGCFVCGGCQQPLSAQFTVDEDGVRKCTACCAKDAGSCAKCGQSVWDEDPMKRMEVLYLEDVCYHPGCYTCTVCNAALQETGAFRVNGELHCRQHKSEAGASPKKKGLTKMDRLMAAMDEQ